MTMATRRSSSSTAMATLPGVPSSGDAPLHVGQWSRLRQRGLLLILGCHRREDHIAPVGVAGQDAVDGAGATVRDALRAELVVALLGCANGLQQHLAGGGDRPVGRAEV